MTRIVKEYDIRRGELLDLSEKLFYTNGYENTSVQQIIDTAQIAKGTFYHYFSSKEELLDQIVKRAVLAVFQEAEGTINDSNLSAIEKLRYLLVNIGNRKVEHSESFFHHAQLLEQNLIFREKMYEDAEKMTAPLLARVIEQGVREGTFNVHHHQATAEMILHMALFIKDYTAHLMLHPFDGEFPLQEMRIRIEAFAEGIERLLGVKPGQKRLIDIEQVMDQFKNFEKLVEDHKSSLTMPAGTNEAKGGPKPLPLDK